MPEESPMHRAWFPIQDGSGKEECRAQAIQLNN